MALNPHHLRPFNYFSKKYTTASASVGKDLIMVFMFSAKKSFLFQLCRKCRVIDRQVLVIFGRNSIYKPR